MEERIVLFIAALRTGGVRISLAESADALRAVDKLGIANRDAFRYTLRTTLIKDSQDLPLFEELFPLFFSVITPPPMSKLSEDLTPEEAQMLAQALRQFTEKLRELLKRLLSGQSLSKAELDRLSELVGMEQADDLRYRDWMSQRMQRALGFKELRDAIQKLSELLQQLGMNRQSVERLLQQLQANAQALREQIEQYSGQRVAENMSQKDPGSEQDNLLNRPFQSLSDADILKLRKEVQRLAAILRTRIALRQKHAKSGLLDAKATIRHNLKHGNVPIQIKHRDRELKPKLLAVCDLSTSMRYCSELMLTFLSALQNQISKTHAFAFISHLEYITPDFTGADPSKAVEQVLARMPSGHYNTNLGRSLKQLVDAHLDLVDNRTTLIFVGDGRNNYHDPRLDLFTLLSRRSRRTIWLNPEPPGLWGTGDSDMLKYAPGCNHIIQVSNLAELSAAIDHLFSQT
jgi:hypothetical protein